MSDDNTTTEPLKPYGKPKIVVATPVNPKCTVCGTTVYSEEAVKTGVKDVNDNAYVYHSSCFKCCHCGTTLNLTSFAQEKGKIYCIQHFREIFGRLGRYDNFNAEKIESIASPPITPTASTSSTAPPKRRSSVSSKPCAYTDCNKPRIGGTGPNFHYCADHAASNKNDNAPPSGWQGHVEKSSKPKKVFGGGGEKCTCCSTTVYPVEAIKTGVANYVYHTACFKCSVCKSQLLISKFAQNEGRLYCPDHFTQLVQQKGGYQGL